MYLSSIFNVVCCERNLPIRMTGGFPFAGKSRLPGHCQLGRTESSMGGRVWGKCTELSWRLVVLDVLWFSLSREGGREERGRKRGKERREECGRKGGRKEGRKGEEKAFPSGIVTKEIFILLATANIDVRFVTVDHILLFHRKWVTYVVRHHLVPTKQNKQPPTALAIRDSLAVTKHYYYGQWCCTEELFIVLRPKTLHQRHAVPQARPNNR